MRALSTRVALLFGSLALVVVACGDGDESPVAGSASGGKSGGSGKGGANDAGASGVAGKGGASGGATTGGSSGTAGTSGSAGLGGSTAGGTAGATMGGSAGATTAGAAGSSGSSASAGAAAGGKSGSAGAPAAGAGGSAGASGGGGASTSGDISFSAPLKWTPPTLVDPETIIVTSADSDLSLDNTKDYILVCDPATKGRVVTDRVTILGGHNVVMKGCYIQRTPGSANSTYPPVAGECPNIAGHAVGTLLARGQTGVMYFEGIYVDLQNTTTNHQNYGVDAIDVGDADGRATLRLGGTATAGEKLTLTFANPLLQALTPAAGYPRVIDVIVPAPASAESTANAIAAAITKDQAAAAVDVKIRAKVKGAVVTFEQEMPHGNRTVTSLTKPPASKLTTAFNRPDGRFRGVTYVFQNVLAANLWSTSCGHHADGIQNQSDLDRLYIDRFTAVSGYQGVQLQPAYNLFDVRLSRLNTRYLDPDCTHINASGDFVGANGVGFWLGTGDDTQNFCAACAYTYQLDAVYAEERVGPKGSKCDGWAAYSLAPPTQATHGASYLPGSDDRVEFKKTLPPEVIGGTVKKGAPSEGDFVPPSLIVNAKGEVVYVPATTFQLASPEP